MTRPATNGWKSPHGISMEGIKKNRARITHLSPVMFSQCHQKTSRTKKKEAGEAEGEGGIARPGGLRAEGLDWNHSRIPFPRLATHSYTRVHKCPAADWTTRERENRNQSSSRFADARGFNTSTVLSHYCTAITRVN